MLGETELQPLALSDALAFLAARHFGRVAVSIGALPAIVAVPYSMIDNAIVFAVDRRSRIADAVSGAVVAFEVDEYDAGKRTGCSVMAVGLATLYTPLEAAQTPSGWRVGPDPSWPVGDLLQLRPSLVSGRSLVDAAAPSAGAFADALVPLGAM